MTRIRSVEELVGIGAVLRDRIIEQLGIGADGAPDERIAVTRINEDPYRLLRVPGIGMQRIVRILEHNFGISLPDVMQRLADEGKGVHAAPLWPDAMPASGSAPQPILTPPPQRMPVRAWRLEDLPGMGSRLAARTVEVLGASPAPGVPQMNHDQVRAYVEGDPYRLLGVPGVGFARADRIAREHFKIATDDPRRHEHANAFLLRREGGVMSVADYRRQRKDLGLSDSQFELRGVRVDSGSVWDENELEAERRVAQWALKACNGQTDPPSAPSPGVLSEMEAFGLNAEQRRACWAGLNLPAMALSGGAGTGKTTTIAALASIASRRGLNVHVMAFAGKGSDRIAEALRDFDIDPDVRGPYGDSEENRSIAHIIYGRIFVSTIHRGLGATGQGGYRLHTLAADLVILDEASMLPNGLLADVLARMRPEARLLLVGDPQQLPPIQYGQPFETLLRLGLPHHRLIQNYRQANQEAIFLLAEAVRAKRPIALRDGPGVRVLLGKDFEANVLRAVEEVLERPGGQDVMQWQVVCALNATRERLNDILQARLNPSEAALARYREGRSGNWVEVRRWDKVVVQKNDYEKGVFNGQTGIVTGVDPDAGAVLVRINDTLVPIEFDLVPDLLRLGYAITTHKSQGSGWPAVIVAEPGSVTLHPNRWTYTSVTRAAEHLVIVSQLDAGHWWEMAFRELPLGPSTLERRVLALRAVARVPVGAR
jgi:exodeoxyribonuclease V alpha subunit